MATDICLDMIISLIKAQKTDNTLSSGKSSIRGAHYLLGQIIRQYVIPDKNHYISKEAKKLWSELSDDNIWNYIYTNPFELKADHELSHFVGAEKTPRPSVKHKKGEKIEFRSVFHDEHIISIEVITKRLCNLSDAELNYEKVKEILDSIVICRILKEEDKKLPRKRYQTFEDNRDKVYKPQGVIIEEAYEEYKNRTRKDI